MIKLCNGPCNLEKPFCDFHKGNGSFGLKSRCKNCCKLSYKNNSKEYKKQYYNSNIQKERLSRFEYKSQHIERYRAYGKAYDLANQAKKAAREALRRAQKLNATPKWLTKAHKEQINSIYLERDRLSKLTGIMYHVDHIVPLIHSDMCGLHVPWNLQVIPGIENLKKSNKVE